MQLNDFATKTVFANKKSPKAEGYHVVALDIGYSGVKVFSPNGVFCFPSFAREFSGQVLSIGKADNKDIIYNDENGVIWNVGHSAQMMLSKDDTNDSSSSLYNRYRYHHPMFKVIARMGIALGLIGKNEEDKLIIQTGLPPDYIKADSSQLKKALSGHHMFQIKIGNNGWQKFDFKISENDIRVMSQPMGSLLSASIDTNCNQIPEANKITKASTLVLDGGFGTVDVFSVKNRRVNMAPQSFDDLGMKAVFERTAEKIFEKYKVEVKVHLMQQYIQNGYVKVFDSDAMKTTKQYFNDLLFKSNKEVCMEIIKRLRGIYNNLVDYNYLLVTGGTGAAWLPIIKEYFKDFDDLTIISGNQNDNLSHIFSNVRGYYMFQTGQLKKQSC